MNEEQTELLFDLLTKKAVNGLDTSEQEILESFDEQVVEAEFATLETAAAAVNMAGISEIEPMPDHLRARILEAAPTHAAQDGHLADTPWPPPTEPAAKQAEPASAGYFAWLGWVVAAAACLLLVATIWVTRRQEVAGGPSPSPSPTTEQALTPAEQREALIASTPGIIQANLAPGNVKETAHIAGDIVWSDEKQAGYLRFRGLPINDATATCYQLWIFDEVQDKRTPIDGGIFDVTADGEVIIPINAKLETNGPNMFAITIERHGGVVVSNREKIAAVAKVETQAS
jgi:hypothetical protein